jgi:hypothetical protein
MKYNVKINFHDKIKNKHYKIDDIYELHSKERADYLESLGLIEKEKSLIDYEIKVIKTRGRTKDANK